MRRDIVPKKELEAFNFKMFKKYEVKNIHDHVILFTKEWEIDTSRQNVKYDDRRNPHLYTNTYVIQDHPLDWKFGSSPSPVVKDMFLLKMIDNIVKDLEDFNVGKAARILLIKLNSESDVATHVDGGEYLSTVRRYHIPIITNENVFYIVNDEKINMKQGECWEINNFKPHSVLNNSKQDRVHLLIDIIPEYSFKTYNNLPENSKIYMIENFIEEEDAENFINYIFKNSSNKEKFPLTRGEVEFKRVRHEANIPETVPLSNHSEQIELIKKYTSKMILNFKNFFKDDILYPSAFWMTMLGKDTRLPYHTDNHIGAEHLYRSAVVYLNDDFTGGYLKFKDFDLTYKPKKYSAVIFPSNYYHMITPVTDGIRYALPMWASKEKKYDIFGVDSPIKSDPEKYLNSKRYKNG